MLTVLKPSTCSQLRSLYNFSRDYIYANFSVSKNVNHICNQMAINLFVSCTRTAILINFSFMLAAAGPTYKLFFTDQKELFVPVILPFINPDTEFGFWVNLIYQLMNCSVGVFVLLGTETGVCVIKGNINISAAIIETEMKELENQLHADEDGDEVHSDENTSIFRNIILQILDLNRLIEIDIAIYMDYIVNFDNLKFEFIDSLRAAMNVSIGSFFYSRYYRFMQ